MPVESDKRLKRFDFRGTQCRNCDAILDVSDRYCHHCSQLNTTKKLSLKDYVLEFFASFFSYDSRIWRTTTTQLFRPGKYPKEYISGKRVSYANPFRFYFTVSIVFFLVVRIVISLTPIADRQGNIDTAGGAIKIYKDPKTEPDNEAKEITPYKFEEPEQATSASKVDSVSGLDPTTLETEAPKKTDFTEDRKPEARLDKDSIAIPDEASPMKRKLLTDGITEEYFTQEQLDKKYLLGRYIDLSQLYSSFIHEKEIMDYEDCITYFEHADTDFNRFVHGRAITYSRMYDDPRIAMDILLPKVPLFVFFFIPIFSLFSWLIYARRRFNYIEHIIFNFSIFIFVFLGMIPLTIIDALLDTALFSGIFLLLIGPFYLYKALRNFYEQSRIKTVLKFLLINVAFFILSILGLGIFTVLGLVIA